jgi:hypothetical protein
VWLLIGRLVWWWLWWLVVAGAVLAVVAHKLTDN